MNRADAILINCRSFFIIHNRPLPERKKFLFQRGTYKNILHDPCNVRKARFRRKSRPNGGNTCQEGGRGGKGEARWNNSARRVSVPRGNRGDLDPAESHAITRSRASIYYRSRGGSNGQRMCRPFNIGVEALVFAPSAR